MIENKKRRKNHLLLFSYELRIAQGLQFHINNCLKHSKLNFFLIVVIVAFSGSLPAQQNEKQKFFEIFSKLDSLKSVFNNARHDTVRCRVLNSLIEAEKDDAIWIKYNEQLKAIAVKNLETLSENSPLFATYSKYLAVADNNNGYFASVRGDNNRAQEFYKRSLAIYEKIKDKTGLANSLINMGTFYSDYADISNALKCYNRSLKIQEEIGNKHGIANCFICLGYVFNSQGEKGKALEYYDKGLRLFEETGDKYEIAQVLNYIGKIYSTMGDSKKALEFYTRGWKINEEAGDKMGMATGLNNVAGFYLEHKDFPKALEYYQKSLKILKEAGHKQLIANSMHNIANAYLLLASTPEYVSHKEMNFAKAIDYCSHSLKLGEQLGFPKNIRNAAKLLNKIYKSRGDYKNALKYYELFILMRDSITNEETKKISVKSQLHYEYGKKMAADSVAHAKENEIKKVQISKQEAEISAKKNQQYVLFGGLGVVIVFSVFMYNRFRITQKQKLIIENQKKIVEEKQKEILDSIYYARRIQRALITTENNFEKQLNHAKKKAT